MRKLPETLSEAGLSELKDEQDYKAVVNPENSHILQILMLTKKELL